MNSSSSTYRIGNFSHSEKNVIFLRFDFFLLSEVEMISVSFWNADDLLNYLISYSELVHSRAKFLTLACNERDITAKVSRQRYHFNSCYEPLFC